MLLRANRLPALSLALTLFLALSTYNSSPQAQEVPTTPGDFSGRWVDRDNMDIQMSVTKDLGVYRVMGGDYAYGYRLTCLVKGQKAICTGDGGQLEGENFLYQSTFEFTQTGMAIENWKAFNNLQTVSGKTNWKRR